MKEAKRYVLPISFAEAKATRSKPLPVFLIAYAKHRISRACTRTEYLIKRVGVELYFAGAAIKLVFDHGVMKLGTLLFGAIE
jgi:hypothetical protein